MREHPRIRTWLTGPRALQQGREIMLYAAARELFGSSSNLPHDLLTTFGKLIFENDLPAAQSRLDPTLPL